MELAFHLLTGICFIVLWRRKMLAGRLFAVYLVAYGIFRFLTEFLRVTPKVFYGLSAYQWFSIAMVIAGAVALYLRRDRQPASNPILPGRDAVSTERSGRQEKECAQWSAALAGKVAGAAGKKDTEPKKKVSPWITFFKVIGFIVLGIVILIALLVGLVIGICTLHR